MPIAADSSDFQTSSTVNYHNIILKVSTYEYMD
jgi:hypothetical protein